MMLLNAITSSLRGEPELVSSTMQANMSNAPTVVITKPASVSVGNLLVAAVLTGGTGDTCTSPAGWTQAMSNPNTSNCSSSMFWRFADGSEGASFTFTSSSARALTGFILNIKNGQLGPVGVATSASGPNTMAPGVNVPTDKCLLFCAAGSKNTSVTIQPPTGMSAVHVDNDASGMSAAMLAETLSAAGPTGNRTIGTGTGGIAFLFSVVRKSYVPGVITEVGVASVQNPGVGTLLVLSRPTGVVDGDLMLALCSGVNGSWTPPGDWNEVADQGTGAGLGAFWKVASSESGTYTFTAASGSNPLGGALYVLRGAAYDAIGTIVSGNTSLAPSVAATASGARVIGFGSRRNSDATIGLPSDMTSVDLNTDAMTPSWRIALSNDWLWASGSFTCSSFTFLGSTNTGAIAISIKPA